jgi:hypothetical protein
MEVLSQKQNYVTISMNNIQNAVKIKLKKN